jgi:hypothetical protein
VGPEVTTSATKWTQSTPTTQQNKREDIVPNFRTDYIPYLLKAYIRVVSLVYLAWGETWVLGKSATNWPIVPDLDDECGAAGGMRIGRGNLSTRRKPVPVPLCPPQIPHDLTWARTRAAAVGNRQLTTWAMARPCQRGKLDVNQSVDVYVMY